MKRITILILLMFLSFGCVGLSSKPSSDLESRMEALEKQIKKIEIMAASGEAAATDRVWPFYGLTGAGNALDGISEVSIGANDTAIGRDSSNYGYIYYWNATHATACNSPACIRPNPTDGTGSWLNVERFYSAAFYSSAADGTHYTDPSNSAAFPPDPPVTEGSITCRDDRDACFVYDGTNWLPLRTGSYGEYTATGTIDSYYCWGGLVTNNGAAGAIVLTLPSAVTLMEVTVACVDDSGSITVQEGSGDVIDEYASIVLDCTVANAEAVQLKAIDATTWVVFGGNGF